MENVELLSEHFGSQKYGRQSTTVVRMKHRRLAHEEKKEEEEKLANGTGRPFRRKRRLGSTPNTLLFENKFLSNRTVVLFLIVIGALVCVWFDFTLVTDPKQGRGVASVRQRQSADQKLDNYSAVRLPVISPPNSFSSPERHRNETQFTVRINTFRREDLLRTAIDHYLTCGQVVAEIVVVWCTAQGTVPSWLRETMARLEHPSINQDSYIPPLYIEEHPINSLNERFRMLHPPKTPAVLSVDDDVFRPCLALELGFAKWRQHPYAMVGYDARAHTRDWKYAYLSTVQKTNQYSISLTRYAFVHEFYYETYFSHMPSPIREFVDKHFNCEDIAMSLWITSNVVRWQQNQDLDPFTTSATPLLVDCWAMQPLQIKLRKTEKDSKAISSTADHKFIRDSCIEKFTDWLDLHSAEFKLETLVQSHPSTFQSCGVQVPLDLNEYAENLPQLTELSQGKHGDMRSYLMGLKQEAAANALSLGLVE